MIAYQSNDGRYDLLDFQMEKKSLQEQFPKLQGLLRVYVGGGSIFPTLSFYKK